MYSLARKLSEYYLSFKYIEGEKLFAKTTHTSNFPRLKFEAHGLQSLNSFNNQRILEVPKPLVLRKLTHDAILVLP